MFKLRFLLVAAVALAAGALLQASAASAYSCGNGTCYCGSSDINPATGLPMLPEAHHDGDCQELVDACARLGGEWHCDFGIPCTGGSCVYD